MIKTVAKSLIFAKMIFREDNFCVKFSMKT